MSKVLVTGGAGYIGSVLVRALLLKGYLVKVFDKLIFGYESLEKFKHRVELIQGDIRNFDEEILEDVSCVIHLAGFSNDPMADYNPQANREVNTLGAKIVAEACAKRGIRFILASTASIYDKGITGEPTLQDENSEVTPSGAYSISKYNGEREVLRLMDNHPNFCPVIIRMGTISGYSPKMRFDLVINTFVKEAFLNKKLVIFCKGYQWRPLIDVNDVANGYIACMEASEEKVKGQLFNLVSNNYQIMDVAHRIKHALRGIIKDLEIDIDYDENRIDRSYKVSGKKIEDVLGFRYRVSIEDSAREVANKIMEGAFTDLNDPKHYTIRWVEFLTNMKKKLESMGGSVF